jgi:hypothetical protein
MGDKVVVLVAAKKYCPREVDLRITFYFGEELLLLQWESCTMGHSTEVAL